MSDFDKLLAALDELISIAVGLDSPKLEERLIEARAGALQDIAIRKMLIDQNSALRSSIPT